MYKRQAGHVAATGIRAPALTTLLVGCGADQSETIRTLEGVAVGRVCHIVIAVGRNKTKGINPSSMGLSTAWLSNG